MKIYPLYILDIDGTISRGDEPIPHAVETIAKLKAMGAKVRYLTNNSAQTAERQASRLTRLGFKVLPGEVVTSGDGVVAACRERSIQKVFVVGDPGLVETLENAGIEISNYQPDGFVAPDGPQGQAVVAGICRTFSYPLLNGAMQQIRRSAVFLATNRDSTYPLPGGVSEPGGGAIVAAIETCTGVRAESLGKPHPFLVELILKQVGVSPTDALVVGDRPETDLEAGKAAGCDTWLVLTGSTEQPIEGQPGSPDLRGLLR